jgi:protein involved in polysaccharide export with SLBB domain
MNKRFHVRTLMIATLVLAVVMAVVAPRVRRGWRRASACYVVGEVAAPRRIETLGRRVTVRAAINEAGGLKPVAELLNIRLVRPHSGGVPEEVLSVDLNDPTTDYTMKPGDRLVVIAGREGFIGR